jgi:hypothetical protein
MNNELTSEFLNYKYIYIPVSYVWLHAYCLKNNYNLYHSSFTEIIYASALKNRGNYLYHLVYQLTASVVRVLGYRSGGPGSIPGTTPKKSSGPGTGSTQPREYN